jgi:mRNA interferase MazF
MEVTQGDLFWLDLDDPVGSEPGYRHPHVVVQNNAINQSAIKTTIVCAVTTNLRLANAPGNVRLNAGEGGLPKQSVVIVTQVFTVNKSELEERIGALSIGRLRQILAGIRLTLEPRDVDEEQANFR